MTKRTKKQRAAARNAARATRNRERREAATTTPAKKSRAERIRKGHVAATVQELVELAQPTSTRRKLRSRKQQETAVAKSLRTTPPAKRAAGVAQLIVPDVAAQWKAGTTIGALAAEFRKTYANLTLKQCRAQVRKAITAAVGGKEQFRTLRAQGAGGTRAAFGGQRARRSRSGDGTPTRAARLDDASVPTITSCKKSDGWTSRHHPANYDVYIHTSPDGIDYVRASAQERADLLVQPVDRSLGTIRLKRFEESAAARAARKQQQLEARGEAALERKAETKAEARARRKAARAARATASASSDGPAILKEMLKIPAAPKRRAPEQRSVAKFADELGERLFGRPASPALKRLAKKSVARKR